VTGCVILYRVNDGPVQYVANEFDSDIAVYPTELDAMKYCDLNGLFQSEQAEYQIVELVI
jgi:hypothetical protein